MPGDRVIVLGFGGSLVRDEDRLRIAVHEIYRWRREGFRVAAVVPALAGRTDELLRRCEHQAPRPCPYALAAIKAGGELEGASILGMHLDRAGVRARVLAPGAAGLRAEGPALDATPVALDERIIARGLDEDGVVAVPGCIATDRAGRSVVLGRGGADLSALFLAHRLGADRCRLIKDIDGPCDRDARDAAGVIVGHEAARLARENGITFELASFNGAATAVIGAAPTGPEERQGPPGRLRAALLGFGTVGRGVYELLRQLPGHFEITGIAVRRPQRHEGAPGAEGLFTDDPIGLAGSDVDVVVEAMGGFGPARSAIEAALRRGTDVVTANKALLAEDLAPLAALAKAHGAGISCSAAVGGAVPVLERLRSRGSGTLRSFRGVLNGTTNFVLDRCAAGTSLAEAVRAAQDLGLAEAEPSRDLGGLDAADKLRIIAQTAGIGRFGADEIDRDELAAASLRPAPAVGGCRLRQVASLERRGGRWRAAVRLERLQCADPLAGVHDEQCAAVLEWPGGAREVLIGRGAGRWPTAEAVLGDLLELARSASIRPHARASAACRHCVGSASYGRGGEPLTGPDPGSCGAPWRPCGPA